jgi:hypothetical protein
MDSPEDDKTQLRNAIKKAAGFLSSSQKPSEISVQMGWKKALSQQGDSSQDDPSIPDLPLPQKNSETPTFS